MFYTVPAVFAAYLQTTLLTVEQLALAALVADADTAPERRCAARICASCGEPIPAGNTRQRYCSLACKQHAYRARRQQPSSATP